MLFFKPEKYKGSKKEMNYNILVSKRKKEGKRERKKIYIKFRKFKQ